MSRLRALLERDLGASAVQAILQRRHIYGGSFDTVVLELGLCRPEQLTSWLAEALHHPVASPAYFVREAGLNRPWDRVPRELVDLGWALPLREDGVGVVVAIHPEIPEEQLVRLARRPDIRLCVAPECCLAVVAAERTGSVVPQRLAILAATYLRHRDEPAEVDSPSPPVSSPSTPSAPPASFAERREILVRAHDRDTITDALAMAAATSADHVALFGVRNKGLWGLRTPGGLDVEGQLIPVTPGNRLDRAIDGSEPLERLSDLDLRLALGHEDAIPCAFIPVRVQDRPVLVLYADRGGKPMDADSLERLHALAALAGEGLTEILRRRAGGPPVAPPVRVEPNVPEPVVLKDRVQREPPPVRVLPLELPRLPLELQATELPPPLPPPPPVELDPLPHTRPALVTIPARPPPPPIPPPPSIPPIDPMGPTLPGVVIDLAAELAAFGQPQDPTGIVSLSPMLGQATVRGRIEFDDEDRILPASDDGIDQRIDEVLGRIVDNLAGVDALRELGPAALSRLARRFPGPLEILGRDPHNLPPPSAHGPLVRAAVELGAEITPYLLELFDHANPEVRFYASFIFQELRDDRCVAALPELGFDGNADVRLVAMRVLETYSRSPRFEAAASHIHNELTSASRARQLHAARASGILRDIGAVSDLIELLSHRDRFVQEAALESLCSITGQQLGLKPHKWRHWYGEHRHEHRVEWIIDSLRHKDIAVRKWAGQELTRITGHRVPHSPTGDRHERDAAVAEWQSWWASEGRVVRFAR